MSSRFSNHLRGNAVGYLALFVALSGTVYAADKVGSNDIKTGAVKSKQIGDDKVKSKDLKDGKAVKSLDVKDGDLTGADIADEALRLRDLGGGLEGTRTVGTNLLIPQFECRWVQDLQIPAPPGLIGSLVIGNITEPDGSAAVDNAGVVMPTMVTETSQGGAFVNIAICNARTGTLSVDEAAIVHWRTIPE